MLMVSSTFDSFYGQGSYNRYIEDDGFLGKNGHWETTYAELSEENDWVGFESDENSLQGINVTAEFVEEEEAQSGGGDDLAKLFGRYDAGYIADENSAALFPSLSFDSKTEFRRYMIEGAGVYIAGMLEKAYEQTTGKGSAVATIATAAIVTYEGARYKFASMLADYQATGDGKGIYVLNVSAPGAFPRAVMFNANNGQSLGWYHTTVKGAPTMQYHIYLKFLQELGNVR